MLKNISLFLLVIKFLPECHADFQCADSDKGICNTSAQFPWCHYSVTNGTFGCDDQGICARQSSIKNTKISTCINKVEDCCCNDRGLKQSSPFMCNYVAVRALGRKHYYHNMTIECDTTVFHPRTTNETTMKTCFDKYCVKMLYRREGNQYFGGLINSCQSWLHYGTLMYEENDPTYAPYKAFGIVKPLLQQEKYRCSNILSDSDKPSVCIETTIRFKNVPYTTRYCCCKDSAKCNTAIGWNHEVSNAPLDATLNSLVMVCVAMATLFQHSFQ